MLCTMLSHDLFIFLLHVDVRVSCSHACMMFWLCLARIYVFMHILPCYKVRSLSSHTSRLGFTFFHVYVLGSTCLHACFYAYISRSMHSYACVLRFILSTCFMLSSMCSCIPYHVCVPRRSTFVAFISFSCVLA